MAASRRLWGVGKRHARKLNDVGIKQLMIYVKQTIVG